MKELLRKRWFLFLLSAGLGLAWLRPGWLRPITVQLQPQAIIAASLFLVALGLDSRHLVRSLVRPWPALWAALTSYAVVPALAWSAGRLLPDEDLRLGLLIIAAVPCTLASAAIWTRMAGGNEATALLTILITIASSWLITPLWLAVGARTSVSIDMGGMMQGLALVLVMPVGVGQLCRASPRLVRMANDYKKAVGTISRLLIACVILKAGVDVVDRLGDHVTASMFGAIALTAVLCGVVHLAGLTIGLWSGRLLRFDRESQIAVAFACSQKTLPVALYLFEEYFKEAFPLAVVSMALYHIEQLIADTFIAEVLSARPNIRDSQMRAGSRPSKAKFFALQADGAESTDPPPYRPTEKD